VLAVMLLLTGTAAACSSGGGHRRDAPTVAEISELLARHARELLTGSRAGFLADVDTAAAAKAFRSRQAAQLDNLADVPLQSWRYSVASPVTDGTALAAATRRYGAPALIVRVSLQYRLRGVDADPDRHDLWWTFVRRGGRVLLAGDDDLADTGGTSWRGPWDFGAVVVARGTSSLVLGHIANATALTRLAGVADAAVPAVTAVWGGAWSQRVAVVVPADGAEFAALTGGTADADVSATAVTAGVDPVTGRPYGQRLVLSPTAPGTLSGVGEQIVVRHELTHLAAAADTSESTPRWVVEGFADYVGERGSGQPVAVAAAELRRDVLAGDVPAALPADSAFAAGAPGRAQAYEQAWLACRLLAARAGVVGLARFYRAVGTAVAPAAQAVATALHAAVGLSLAAFTAQWRAYLIRELG
jgi:hypothetical protein